MTNLDPALFGEGPARDARFDVRERLGGMVNHAGGHARSGRWSSSIAR